MLQETQPQSTNGSIPAGQAELRVPLANGRWHTLGTCQDTAEAMQREQASCTGFLLVKTADGCRWLYPGTK